MYFKDKEERKCNVCNACFELSVSGMSHVVNDTEEGGYESGRLDRAHRTIAREQIYRSASDA